ncbi:hypothetical protein NHX12_028610 [Muraenolepis orangiensis]|uniref:Uncharacterized protein n=1 Tax=Muraenolepis orangiensis TaxID=630683 RepID=A0A9Q0EC48_9TELE|nr:hypothetical protein NHX12_028610 [Muraenolepis orangiensis]
MIASSTCPRPGSGAPGSVRLLLWECSAAEDQWETTGSLQFPYLPAQLVLLFGVSQNSQIPCEFPKQWLNLAAIKDAMWTSRNLPVAVNLDGQELRTIVTH